MEKERDDTAGMTPAERTRAIQEMTIRIIELERDLPDLYLGAARDAVLNEIDRCKYRLTRLLEERDEQPVEAKKPRRRSNFYPVTLALLVIFLVSGAFFAAGIIGILVLARFFTTESPRPAYAGRSTEVVKE